MPGPRAVYHYVDAHGTDVIVEGLENVPTSARTTAARVDGEGANLTGLAPANVTRSATGVADIEAPPRAADAATSSMSPFVGGLHLPSMLVGALLAGLLALLFSMIVHPKYRSLKSMSAALLIAVIGTVWFVNARHTAADAPAKGARHHATTSYSASTLDQLEQLAK